MRFCDPLLLSYPVSPPVDVKQHKGHSKNILVGPLVVPRFVLLRPRDFVVIGELSGISGCELFFEYLGLDLMGKILMVSPPVIEVIIVGA